MKDKIVLVVLVVLVSSFVTLPSLAQQKSAKRGMGWDEKTQPMSEATVEKMAPGISWVYNWGATPKRPQLFTAQSGMVFVPMCWNSSFNEGQLRTYLADHPEVKILLGFNEPNFSSQANMSPQQAATAWPRLEQIARDYGLQLVAPALNFTGERVGGRVWSPFEWLDEFLRLYPAASFDYLAMHCYMNWAENTDWICNRYFYTANGKDDLYTPSNAAKYPHLVAFLDGYKAAHGHFPQMYLTEFCSWEDNVYPYRNGLTEDFQIDQMTQKLQYMERSPLVAGYAWFMANPGGGSSEHPHESIFERNTADSPLSALGQVYVYMSAFDGEKYYVPGEPIQAKDYIDASMDDIQVRVRPNTETASALPLQIELQQSAWAAWQIDVPSDGSYTLTLHLRSEADCGVAVYLDDFHHKLLNASLTATAGTWADRELTVSLTAGRHSLYLWNGSTAALLLNALSFQSAAGSGISHVQHGSQRDAAVYDLQGRRLAKNMFGDLCVVGGKKLVRLAQR